MDTHTRLHTTHTHTESIPSSFINSTSTLPPIRDQSWFGQFHENALHEYCAVKARAHTYKYASIKRTHVCSEKCIKSWQKSAKFYRTMRVYAWTYTTKYTFKHTREHTHTQRYKTTWLNWKWRAWQDYACTLPTCLFDCQFAVYNHLPTHIYMWIKRKWYF